MHWLTSNLKALISWAEAGLAIAFFAWIFDVGRRRLFGRSSEALRSLSHGWIRFRLTVAEVDLADTMNRRENPHVAIAIMIQMLAGVTGSFILLLFVAFNEFVQENYALNNFFFPRIPYHMEVSSIFSLIVVVALFVCINVMTTELDRLLNSSERIQKIQDRVTKFSVLYKKQLDRRNSRTTPSDLSN